MQPLRIAINVLNKQGTTIVADLFLIVANYLSVGSNKELPKEPGGFMRI